MGEGSYKVVFVLPLGKRFKVTCFAAIGVVMIDFISNLLLFSSINLVDFQLELLL